MAGNPLDYIGRTKYRVVDKAGHTEFWELEAALKHADANGGEIFEVRFESVTRQIENEVSPLDDETMKKLSPYLDALSEKAGVSKADRDNVLTVKRTLVTSEEGVEEVVLGKVSPVRILAARARLNLRK